MCSGRDQPRPCTTSSCARSPFAAFLAEQLPTAIANRQVGAADAIGLPVDQPQALRLEQLRQLPACRLCSRVIAAADELAADERAWQLTASCRSCLHHASSVDQPQALRLEQLRQLAVCCLGGRVIAAADELAADEDARHGGAACDLLERCLQRRAISPLVQLSWGGWVDAGAGAESVLDVHRVRATAGWWV